MSGIGKTTAARRVARRHDVWLYSVDARTYAHAEAMRVPALTMTVDELWLERSPEQMVDDFLDEARARFSLIRAEIAAIPEDGAPVLAEGPQLLPGLVPEPALFVVASPALQRELLGRRGSLTHSATSDPERAFANRVRRDELLAQRLRHGAVEIKENVPIEEMWPPAGGTTTTGGSISGAGTPGMSRASARDSSTSPTSAAGPPVTSSCRSR